MRFLVDANLSPSLATALELAGHDAVHVVDLSLLAASDVEILERARVDSRNVITADTDFPMLLAISGADAPSLWFSCGTSTSSPLPMSQRCSHREPAGRRGSPGAGSHRVAQPDPPGCTRTPDPRLTGGLMKADAVWAKRGL